MRLHAIMGFSPLLLIKAMKSFKWDSVIIYTSKKGRFEKICAHFDDLPPVEYISMPVLDDTTSIEGFTEKLRSKLMCKPKVGPDEILFYSGPPVAFTLAYLLLKFKSFMTYNTNRSEFLCSGMINTALPDTYNPDETEFLEIHDLKLVKENDARFISRKSGKGKMKILQIEGLEVSSLAMQIHLAKPPSSGQRKKKIHGILLLRKYLGPHSFSVVVEDELLARWTNRVYNPLEDFE